MASVIAELSNAAISVVRIRGSCSGNNGTAFIPAHCPVPRTTMASTSGIVKSGVSSADVEMPSSVSDNALFISASRGSNQRIANVGGNRWVTIDAVLA
jgi:hypothetical protein